MTVINPIEVPKGKEAETLAVWESFAEYFSKQPGFVSAKLHRSINPNAKFLYVNVAEWKSLELFTQAISSDGVKKLGSFPKGVIDHPSGYEIIRDISG